MTLNFDDPCHAVTHFLCLFFAPKQAVSTFQQMFSSLEKPAILPSQKALLCITRLHPQPPINEAVPAGDGPARSYGKLRRSGGYYAVSPSGNRTNRLSIAMRVRSRDGGGDVEIEGVGGEARRVQRRSRRRPDLMGDMGMRQIALQVGVCVCERVCY